MTQRQDPVHKRLVVYFSGFDPAGPGRYHRIYAQQASLAAPTLHADIYVSELQHRQEMHLSQWQVNYRPTEEEKQSAAAAQEVPTTVETDYVFARWDDIAQQHWHQLNQIHVIGRFIKDFLATHWLFLRSGTMLKIARLDKSLAGMLLMPLLLFLGAIFFGLISAAFFAASLMSHLLPTISLISNATYPSVALGLALFTVAWIAAMALLERKWHMLWVMRSFIFTSRHAQGKAAEIEKRLDRIAEHMAAQIEKNRYDEVLVVGHSTGSIMATLALSRVYEKTSSNHHISFLTLGQWWPWLGCLPDAQFAQTRLRHLVSQKTLTWVDVSAAADGCSFSFVDPVATLKDAPAACVRPKLISARWHTLFPRDVYRQLRKNPFRIHMQYLYSTPKLGVCDFFAITAGPLRLAARFSEVSSVSR